MVREKKRLNSTTTQSIINVLETWFNTLGWPSNIRSHGGPQFLGPFRQWYQKNNITHELSSPYNPKSKELAEAAVKNIKLLLSKCSITKEDPQRALYYWRNIPRTDGYSPAQLLMGRKQFTQLPAAPAHYAFYDPATAQANKDKAFQAAQRSHDQHTSFLFFQMPPPPTGQWGAYHTQAGSQFISSHSFPVPATGLITSPSSAPAHCWC